MQITNVQQSPNFFSAYDLKADICMAQGEIEAAEHILKEVSEKTPKNFLRKRKLVEAARSNGNPQLAHELMKDILKNDNMPGAITIDDHLEMARTLVDTNEPFEAYDVLRKISQEAMQRTDLETKASLVSLMILADPGMGDQHWKKYKTALNSAEFKAGPRVDMIRAALSSNDNETAAIHTRKVFAGGESKQYISQIKNIFAAHGQEDRYRKILKEVAMARSKI